MSYIRERDYARLQRSVQKRREQGVCLDCSQPAMMDRRYCERHLAIRRRWMAERRRRAKECRGRGK